MPARFLPLLALALLAPLVAVIALHRSGTGLGQPRLSLAVEARGLPAGTPLELRATYRARRCLPFLTCRADWTGGPARPIEIERRRAEALGPGASCELGGVPRTLLSLASFELSAVSLRLGRGGAAARADLIFEAGGARPDAGGRCAVQLPPEGSAARLSPSCARVEVSLLPAPR